ncbi:TPA: hypothetical protein TZS71_001860 [Streptococcus suis]|nr:hypothetical protein [Streptococcus suis]
MDNVSNIDMKRIISILFGALSIYLVTTGNKWLVTLSIIIIIGLIYFWHDFLKKWLCNMSVLYHEVRMREYFFVTDEGYRTDLKKRRELGEKIYKITNFSFFTVIILLVGLSTIFGKITIPISVLSSVFLWIATAGIMLQARNYLTSLYYYLIPIIPVLLYIDLLKRSEILALIIFFVLIAIIYLIFVLIVPIHSLRKINNTTLIFGVLLSIAVPILFEYIISIHFSDYFLSTINPLVYKEFMQSIESKQVYNFIIDNPDISNLLKIILDTLGRVELNEEKEIFSRMSFLWLSSYAIGSLIINAKLKIGSLVAKDLFMKVQQAVHKENVKYELLRDCVYFGDERIQDFIVFDEVFYSIIQREERQKQFYQETNKLILIIQRIIEFFKKQLKRCVYKEKKQK